MSNYKSTETDEFKLVTHKRGKKPIKSSKTSVKNTQSEVHLNKDLITSRVNEAKSEIKSSDLFASALASLREGVEILSRPTIKEIICFGLGKIDFYNVDVKVYDPVFTDLDCWLLEQFGCEILKENYEGKYQVTDKNTRLFYMPHCPKQLTNNLLYSNWGLNLNYCVIVANSFSSIIEQTPSRILNKSAQYIVNIAPHMVELPLINSFRLYEIFNDTAIHIFPWNKIKLLSDDFWSFHIEPDYSDDDVEFIRNQLSLISADPTH